MSKRFYFIIAIIITLIFLILLSVFLFNIGNSNNQTELSSENNSKNELYISNGDNEHSNSIEIIRTTNSGPVKLSPNATITFCKNYSQCGHTIKTKEKISNSMVNLTQTELQNLYSDWTIDKFSSLSVELSKNISGYCGEHYLVKTQDGYVVIYNIEPSGDLTLKETTDIISIYLTPTDISNLESGVVIYGRNNLNAYIEDFE